MKMGLHWIQFFLFQLDYRRFIYFILGFVYFNRNKGYTSLAPIGLVFNFHSRWYLKWINQVIPRNAKECTSMFIRIQLNGNCINFGNSICMTNSKIIIIGARSNFIHVICVIRMTFHSQFILRMNFRFHSFEGMSILILSRILVSWMVQVIL